MVNNQVKYFLFGDITNNPAMNGLGWPYLTFLPDLYLGVESLCHEICIAPTLLNNANKLLKVSTFPSVKYECSNYSTSLPTCVVACFCFVLFCFHSACFRSGLVSHWDFNFYENSGLSWLPSSSCFFCIWWFATKLRANQHPWMHTEVFKRTELGGAISPWTTKWNL